MSVTGAIEPSNAAATIIINRAMPGEGRLSTGHVGPRPRLAIHISVVAAPRGIRKRAAWSDPKSPRSPRSTPIAPKPADAASAANSVLSSLGVLNTESSAVPSPNAAISKVPNAQRSVTAIVYGPDSVTSNSSEERPGCDANPVLSRVGRSRRCGRFLSGRTERCC